MRRRATAVLLALAGAGMAGAAPADAAKVFEGETGQSRKIVVRVGDDGRVARVTVSWRAACRRRGAFVRDATVVRPSRRSTTTEVFAVRGAYRTRSRGGFRLRVRMRVQGRRDVRSDGSERWTGTLRARIAVLRRGRPYDRCALRTTVWHAELPLAPAAGSQPQPSPAGEPAPGGPPPPGPWRFEMTGDSGDYITGGRNWVHEPPHDRISGGGGWGGVSFSIDTADGGWWSVDFAPPTGQRFEPGRRYTDARRYPFNDGHPGLSIGGMGRGCNELTGEFTIHEIDFDRRGHLRRFRASFEQHCEGGAPAARGTMDYSAGTR